MNSTFLNYTSDEVKDFHPFFELCLSNVLKAKNLEDELEIVHHWTVSGFSGIVDFVIRNRKSKKILLPIEIKKTPSDLKALGRKQARGYWNDLGDFRGSDFYMATNLEIIELFRNDKNRPLTLAQLVQTDKTNIGLLSHTPRQIFQELLEEGLSECIDLLSGNDGTKYSSNISGLIHALEFSLDDPESWHQAQAHYVFDYVKGALIADELLGPVVSDWDAAVNSFVRKDIFEDTISMVDFDLIYKKKIQGRFNQTEIQRITAGAFDAGKKMDYGQDLNFVVNEIARTKLNIAGLVETEAPLAEMLLGHARKYLLGHPENKLKIMEPGCGSGNMLVAAKKVFPALTANNVIGIEEQEIFRGVLATRIGLHYIESLKLGKKPNLFISNILDLDPAIFHGTNLVAMNPSFVRGVDAVDAKREFAQKFFRNFGKTAKLSVGQLGLECAFLEYVTALVENGTVLSTVFPLNSLTRPQSHKLREFLLDEFGLKEIVIYEDTNIFQHVQKKTVVLIGGKGQPAEDVKVFNYKDGLEESPRDEATFTVARNDLQENIFEGWASVLSDSSGAAQMLIENIFSRSGAVTVGEKFRVIRGSAGNSGGSDFIFSKRKADCQSSTENVDVAECSLDKYSFPGARNSDAVSRRLNGQSAHIGFVFPASALNEAEVEELIESYISRDGNQAVSGSQHKKVVTKEKLLSIIARTAPVDGFFVLVPRASRATCEISISAGVPVVVSTNFVIIKCDSAREVRALCLWLLSSFGQLQLEAAGVNQEGMRKVEVAQIQSIKIPRNLLQIFSDIEHAESLINETPAVNFNNLEVSMLDLFLGRYLFGDLDSAETTNAVVAEFQKLVALRMMSRN